MSGEWIKHKGGACPVPDHAYGKVEFRDGVICGGRIDNMDWRHAGKSYDVVAYRVCDPNEQEPSEQSGREGVPSPVVSDGGSSEYYKLAIKNKAGETLSCEMGDIIRAVVNNDFDLGNILKAARRMSLAAQGVGKEGTSVSYDANKIKWFADEFAFWHEVF